MCLQERPKFGAKLVRIKKHHDVLVQNCDVYIGNRISNSHWQLPRSDWANFYMYQEDSLVKYANHIRHRMWRRLNELEGKILGCWCDDPDECHGSVLIALLEQKKTRQLKGDLNRSGLNVDPNDLGEIANAFDWAKDKRFLAYATRLDRTNVFYFQPQIYEAIKKIWGIPGPKYWKAHSNDGKTFFVVGLYNGAQPIGPFWDENADLSVLENPFAGCESMQQVKDIFVFAKSIQPYLSQQQSEFSKSLKFALNYHMLHRCLVRRVGNLTKVDMADHDLTKSRIVHIGLAYAYHWCGGQRDDQLLKLAGACVRAGHCSQEDHHPEFEVLGRGRVDTSKLFVDRVSVHVQKDPNDGELGWGVAKQWIPEEYQKAWSEFKSEHRHNDLYSEGLSKAKSYLHLQRNKFCY